MSFDAAAMLAALYADPREVTPNAEPRPPNIVAERPLALTADPDGEDANEAHWQAINDADRDYLLGRRNWPTPCPWCGGRLAHHQTCDDLRREWVPVMAFGKYRGRRVDELPEDYIDWLLVHGVGGIDFRSEVWRWLDTNRTGSLRTSATGDR